jgi:transcriptional regulator with XRE-family HTH domain
MMNDEQVHAPTRDWQLDWGRLLRTARQVAGLSLSELSARTGLSKGYLSKLESGHATALNPSRATLAALARALPSFRSLAHTLEPAGALSPLTFAAPVVPEALLDAGGEAMDSPVRLGWRELEVVVALMTLERAAVPQPLTALLIARALGRPRADVQPVLDRLTAMGVLHRLPPMRPGDVPRYARAGDFESRVGIARVGDALILAAALLAQTPAQPRLAHTPAEREA